MEPGRHSAAEDDKKVSVQQPVAQPVDSWTLDTAGLGICRFFLNKKKLNSLGIELVRGGDYADVQWQINGLVDHIIRGVLGWACVEDGRTDRFR